MSMIPDSKSPGVAVVEITPSDTADLQHPLRSIWIGSEGDIRVTVRDPTTFERTTATFKGAPVGAFLPDMHIIRVWATGTTAGDIVGVL